MRCKPLFPRQKLSCVQVLSVFLLLLVAGCPDNTEPDNWGTITGGVMQGINGFEGQIAGTITVNPEDGPFGTPIDVLVQLTTGADLVETVCLYDAMATSDTREFAYFQLRYTLDQIADDSWAQSKFLYLSGLPGLLRFYGLNHDGDKVCVGDVSLNGGIVVPSWQDDGIGTTKDYGVGEEDELETMPGALGPSFR